MARKKESGLATRLGGAGIFRPWDFWGPHFSLDELDRWLDQIRSEFERELWRPALWPWRSSALPDIRQPLVDIEDKGSEFLMTAEIPGVSKEDIDISVTEDGVEIKAETKREKEEEERGYYRKERSYKQVYRSLSFPSEILPDKAEASMENGLLRLRLPKKEVTPGSKAYKVKVK